VRRIEEGLKRRRGCEVAIHQGADRRRGSRLRPAGPSSAGSPKATDEGHACRRVRGAPIYRISSRGARSVPWPIPRVTRTQRSVLPGSLARKPSPSPRDNGIRPARRESTRPAGCHPSSPRARCARRAAPVCGLASPCMKRGCPFWDSPGLLRGHPGQLASTSSLPI
jgi:hypothetical protein